MIPLFFIGLALGYIYSHRGHNVKEDKVSDYNWISRYDLYDYEETILKEGDYNKLVELISEADVDRLPYVIVMYDTYNNTAAGDLLLQFYILYQRKIKNHNKRAMIPITDFVKTVITESSEKGHEFDSSNLKEFKKYE